MTSAVHLYRQALRAALASESKAYGFTLTVWGTGSIASSARGMPHPKEVTAFLGGSLAAIALVVLISFGPPLATWKPRPLKRFAFGALHVGSVAAAVSAGWLASTRIPSVTLAFLGAGFAATLVYQLLLGLEVAASTADPAHDG